MPDNSDDYYKQLESNVPTPEFGGEARGEAKLSQMHESESRERDLKDLKEDQ